MDQESLEYFKKALEEKTIIHGKIGGAIPHAAIMYVNGVRCIIPESGLSLEPIEDTVFWLERELDVQVFRIDEKKGQVFLSARNLLIQEQRRKERQKREEARQLRMKKFSSLHVGDIVPATVKDLQEIGAFVDLGDGLDGLIRLSQISTERIAKASDKLAVGDEVQAMVTSLRDGKVGLSIRRIAEKEAEDARRKEEAEYPKEYRDKGQVSTNIAGILARLRIEE